MAVSDSDKPIVEQVAALTAQGMSADDAVSQVFGPIYAYLDALTDAAIAKDPVRANLVALNDMVAVLFVAVFGEDDGLADHAAEMLGKHTKSLEGQVPSDGT